MQESDMGRMAAELLDGCLYANIASMGAEGPWNTPVTAMADAGLHVYWSSWTQAMHSQNIARDGRVFLTFFDSTRPRGTNNLRCLYLRARAQEVVSREEGEKAHRLIYPGEAVELDTFFDAGLKRFYRATPEKAWLNVLSERQLTPQTVKMREEVPLSAIRAARAK